MKKITDKKYRDAKRLVQIKEAQDEQEQLIRNSQSNLFIVRCYDRFDGYWFDITKAVSLKEAKRIYNKETKNGTIHICYDDATYYQIFPANTKMLFR